MQSIKYILTNTPRIVRKCAHLLLKTGKIYCKFDHRKRHYPLNNGFYGAIEEISLDVGTVIQRTGSLEGSFVAPAGTPLQMLSLPYDKIGEATRYFQTTQPIQVLSGTVAPWFGQLGGGTAYLLACSISQLLEEGVLKIFGE